MVDKDTSPPRRPVWHWVLVAALGAWIVITAIQWLSPTPLGHDEAQYALAARDFLAGVEPRWIYLSPGMNAIAIPGIFAGESEQALRFVPFLLGLGFALATTGFARRAVGGVTAAWTIALLAGSRPLIQRTTELLSDVPATLLLISAMWMILAELDREDGPRWRIVLAAPLLSGAFYVRYGSCIPIALICVFAVALWWRAVLRRPLPVLATAALFALLFVPHALTAQHLTGRVFGILLDSKGVPGGSTGDGLIGYLTANPFRYYGALVPFVLVAGLLAIVLIRRRAVAYLWLVAVGDIIGMGVTTIAQPRYIFLGTTLLAMLGVEVLRRFVEARPRKARRRFVIGALAMFALSWIACAAFAIGYPPWIRGRLAGLYAAMDVIRRDAGNAPCQVINRHTTQVEWYWGCIGAWQPPLEAIERGEHIYAVHDDTGGDQPNLDALPGRHRIVLDLPAVRAIQLQRSE